MSCGAERRNGPQVMFEVRARGGIFGVARA